MNYKIVSKWLDRETRKHLFTIQADDGTCFKRYAEEVSKDKEMLLKLGSYDIFDIAYTQGTESAWREIDLLKQAKADRVQP